MAEARYGVVFDGDTVDENATRERRRALDAARVHVALHPTDSLDETRVSGVVLTRAPLRLWLAAIGESNGEHAFVSAATPQMLGLAQGTPMEIRALLPPPA